MNRIDLLNSWLTPKPDGTYLEIGVSFGNSFAPIRTGRKISIDPLIRMPRLFRRLCANNAKEVHYIDATSDDFFAHDAHLVAGSGIDAALIDGLHTYEQSLIDVENTLRYLNEDGLIVMHDCNPTSPSMAYRTSSYARFRKDNRWRLLWCGDVWKTIVHLRSTRNDLQVAVLDCDFGLGIVRRGRSEGLLDYSPADIRAMSYADLHSDRRRLLNLKDPSLVHTEVLAARSV